MSPRRDDERGAQGVAALVGTRPGGVLAVPCGTRRRGTRGDGAVEKHGCGPFSFDDIELATLLAGIAGSVLEADDATGAKVPSPRELGDGLAHLAAADPQRYAASATFLTAVLGDG